MVIITEPMIKVKKQKQTKIPFPTLYYLTDPYLTSKVSSLEANHYMKIMEDILNQNKNISNDYRIAHQHYLKDRNKIKYVEHLRDFSAGGMPNRVKCLHALLAHSLSTKKGINPIGDLTKNLLIADGYNENKCYCK
jgi:hypothetical protein